MSEVSSSGGIDEKEQISVPRDLFHDFESLKNVTNLTTVDLMRRLLGEYQSSQRADKDDSAEELCRQRLEPDISSRTHDTTHGESRNITATPTLPSSSIGMGKTFGRVSRKPKVPGQKLKQVCEILHCKHAARELAEQKKFEATERNCQSSGSSSSGTAGSLEEPVLVTWDFEPVGLDSMSPAKTRLNPVSKAPFAHSSNSQDAANLRKLLGSRYARSGGDHSFESTRPDTDNMALDLSLHKPSDDGNSSSENMEDNESFKTRENIISDTAVMGGQNCDSPVSAQQQDGSTNIIDVQKFENQMYVYPVRTVEGPVDSGYCFSQALDKRSPAPRQCPPPQVSATSSQLQEIPSAQRNVIGVTRMRTRTRRQVTRKSPACEGMKLINENSLYPGVYTSTFKLPGSRRGRRSAASKQVPQQNPPPNSNVMVVPPATTASQSNMVIPVKMSNGNQQPYMMLCPQVAVSSVLMKSPRKRGRPPKRPTIAQFQATMDHQQSSNPMGVAQPQMTISIPKGGNPSLVSSENGAVTYLFQPHADQSSITIPRQALSETVPSSGNLSAPIHPNHSQLVNVLNHATSISACNPVFVPNSSLQPGIPTAVPTNSAGLITLPLQQANPDQTAMLPNIPTGLVAPMQFNQQETCEESPKASPKPEKCDQDSGGQFHNTESKVNVSDPLKGHNTSGVFQEMILSPQALVNVKPRSKPTTTELIRSNSNFYCGSFKIRPQKPSTQSGHGVPLKRGRGRPRLNVFESSSQRETKESRSRMYQELYHCKVCNEILSASERLCHQRKHIAVKQVCPSCGYEHHGHKSSSFNKESQCPQCKTIFDNDLRKKRESPVVGVDEDICESVGSVNSSEEMDLHDDHKCEELACQLCAKVFTSTSSYLQHINEHEESTPEEACIKRFRGNSDTKRHSKHFQSKGKEHTCIYDGCEKKFMKNFHLQEHIRVKHFNIKAFKCPWPNCLKEFAGIRHLKVHMLIHRDEKPLKCDYCDYRCRQRNALNWHMRKHPEVSFRQQEDLPGSDSDLDDQGIGIDLSVRRAGSASGDISPRPFDPENEYSDPDSDPGLSAAAEVPTQSQNEGEVAEAE